MSMNCVTGASITARVFLVLQLVHHHLLNGLGVCEYPDSVPDLGDQCFYHCRSAVPLWYLSHVTFSPSSCLSE